VEHDDVYFVAFRVDECATIRSVLDDDPPPGGHSRVDAGLGVVVRDEEVDMDAVAMLPPEPHALDPPRPTAPWSSRSPAVSFFLAHARMEPPMVWGTLLVALTELLAGGVS
jgi:hypothetical protein